MGNNWSRPIYYFPHVDPDNALFDKIEFGYYLDIMYRISRGERGYQDFYIRVTNGSMESLLKSLENNEARDIHVGHPGDTASASVPIVLIPKLLGYEYVIVIGDNRLISPAGQP